MDIVFIRANSFRSEPRLVKQYELLSKEWSCKMLLWNLDSIPESHPDAISFKTSVKFGSPLLKVWYMVWFVWCLVRLMLLRPKIIHACDLEGNLIANVYCGIFRRTKHVYDLYDAMVGKYNLNHNTFSRRSFLALEKWSIKNSDLLLIPDAARLQQLEFSEKEEKKLNYVVIYNSEVIAKNIISKIDFKKTRPLKVVYVGILSKDIRGLEQLIRLGATLENVAITIAGFGVDAQYVEDLVRSANTNRVTFLGRIPYEKSQELNRTTDLMISLMDPEFNNYKYASSTKIFEAFQLLKPIITTKGTASAVLVEKSEWGVVINYEYETLESTLNKILSGEITFCLDSNRVKQFSWEASADQLLTSYRTLIPSHV